MGRPVRRVLLLILFGIGLYASLPLGVRIAEPMTHMPIGELPEMPFPILVMRGSTPAVVLVRELRQLQPLPAGSSYLIETDRISTVQRELARQGQWTLTVRSIGADRERIELYWTDDGYNGGVYEATPTTIVPLYRKYTGPGFALVVGGVAFAIAAFAWAAAYLVYRGIARLRPTMVDRN